MTDANHADADDLLRLTALCPPPMESGKSRSDPSEQTVRNIPGSHHNLVRTYGTGCFDEFLWIFATGADNVNLDIDAATSTTQSTLGLKDAPTLREALSRHHTTPEDLIQWGVTDNGDSLLWIPDGDPAGWPTAVIQAGQLDFAISPRSSTGVVLDLLTGALRLRFFPDDFPSSHPEFSPNPYT
ncbi:hypothetical protein B1C81_12260 [Streptomyces sp. HG99]|nr:hypothetical protein B1C81_12260 [Streptomyces sp. HG99]